MKTIISFILLLTITLNADNEITGSQDICANTNKAFSLDGFSCPNVGELKLYFSTNSYTVTKKIF